jgi:hypothetical protein
MKRETIGTIVSNSPTPDKALVPLFRTPDDKAGEDKKLWNG